MPRRKWDARTKATIVLQGLKGRPVDHIFIEHQISQAQYYQWRDQLMQKLPQVFVNTQRRQASLERENKQSSVIASVLKYPVIMQALSNLPISGLYLKRLPNAGDHLKANTMI